MLSELTLRAAWRRASIPVALASALFAGGCAGSLDAATTGSTTGSSSTGTSGGGTSGGATTGSGTTGGASDTFTNWASPAFFQLYCVSCHSAGKQGDPSGSNLDWTSFSDVQLNANDIRCGVAVTQDPSWQCPSNITKEKFPIGNGPQPSDLDRIRLVAWIDAGVPQ